MAVRELKESLNGKGPGLLTRFIGDFVCYGRSAAKIDTEYWLRTILQNVGNLKVVLSKLIVRSSYMLAAQLDTSEGIEAIEDKISRRSIGVSVLGVSANPDVSF